MDKNRKFNSENDVISTITMVRLVRPWYVNSSPDCIENPASVLHIDEIHCIYAD